MSIAPGTRFSHYEVVDAIGAGGMGEVWRARDTSLKRDVALKVLPEAFVTDTDRLARLQREAEILASLNHPNIAQVYGFERANGETAIVMELVEGQTLADRIRQGPIPPDEAIAIGLQIVAALEAAHAKGIVHRDLKPANVSVRDDGTVKVLDFGISKPIDPQAISGASPVMTTPAVTQTGVILGTAAYMSPEQARGKNVDERTDIWAFGCVLFEMLTGQPAFGGEDVMLTLARVLDRPTDLSSIPKTIPPAVRNTIRLCLEKDSSQRIADIRDVRLGLNGSMTAAFTSEPSGTASRRGFSPGVAFFMGLLLAGGILFTTYWSIRTPPAIDSVTRFSHPLPAGNGFPTNGSRVLDISASGGEFAYLAGGYFLRAMDELEARRITGLTGSDIRLSPDGAFVATAIAWEGRLVRVPVGGGQQRLITNFDDFPNGYSWDDNGFIWYPQSDGVWQVAVDGGQPVRRIAGIADEKIFGPQLVPELNSILLTSLPAGATNWDAARIYLVSLKSEERTLVIDGGSDGRLLPSGHLAYTVGNDVLAFDFDIDRLPFLGRGERILGGVMRGTQSPVTQYAVSDDGTLVYVPALSEVVERDYLVWVDRQGRETNFGLEQQLNFRWIRLSPDGQQVAATILNPGPALYVSSVARPAFRQVADTPAFEFPPIWTPDQQSLIFSEVGASAQHRIYRARIDRVTEPEVLITLNTTFLSAEDLLDGGSQVLFTLDAGRRAPPDQDESIAILELEPVVDGQRRVRQLIDRESDDSMVTVSPDGNWLVYQSEEPGGCGIYVEQLSELGDRVLVSDESGGWGPAWSFDGTEIFYRRLTDGDMISVPFDLSSGLRIADRVGDPVLAFPNNDYGDISDTCFGRAWDVGPDDRFLMIKNQDVAVSGGIVVVKGWFQIIEELAPTY